MRRTVCRCAVQNILHDVQAAAESRTLVATSSFAQRRAFLMALHDELRRNSDVITRANRRDCEVFGQQQQQRGTPSVTIPPTIPSAAAATAVVVPSPAAGRSMPSSFGRSEAAFGGPMSTAHSPGKSTWSGAAAAPSRPRSSLEYVASTTVRSSLRSADTSAGVGDTERSGETGCTIRGGGSPMQGTNAAPTTTAAETSRCASDDHPSSAIAAAAAAESTPTHHGNHTQLNEGHAALFYNSPHAHDMTSHSASHTEVGGGGGHLLFTPDHHLLISPLRLDKLHTTIDYLLCQPDPIAVPPSCWLHPYAERGSGEAMESQRGHSAQDSADVAEDGDDGRRSGHHHHQSGTSPQYVKDGLAPQAPYTRYGRCTRLTDQLEVFELPVPLGMVGILSRFRPRISLDAVAMGLFAGNTVLVDGGVSLYYTNIALMTVVRRALTAAGLPANAVVSVEGYDAEHRSTSEWLQLSEYVDLAVVCGPPKLYQFASRHSTIPLMRATGQFSSVYVDQSASFEVALEVILNSKFQKLGAANAVTTVIVHRDFPRYTELLMALAVGGAALLGDAAAQERVPDAVRQLASEEEYQGLSQYGVRDGTRMLCVKTVDSLAQALFFTEAYGSKQSDCVVATDAEVCATYCRQVDTAVTLVNASTRLASGVPLGCGVDFAISTSKVHCRGPLTLNMMTTRKLVARSRSMHRGALR
ncbi:gamma-glutamyl phosphate reductase-like protein [Leptomonas pyrrhocoris]|uniref:Gamma-glutamyl phosphate reductase-like protein n=1 Tax=Leptomonas pyrrhocoris TaxID=157538 RepID=A0A0N0VCU4_LEPPY|nr:gamma-glutamyl phosphate reductase-like protein [Leptomonas pyrrhocoris]KPA73808.1 gamma-glutamyl phosphate reductase-like protein [Leptomonas pyrrhocoris]|eukprot:XP_015652247.1 gamma-glutamyl phosphate reductase-like protein [Leptomonas pyrrhocoris]